MIFNAEMVRAILDGRKTQTRRIIKNQPFDRSQYRHDHQIEIISGRSENGDEVDGLYAYTSTGGTWSAKCPFGQPGDRLWGRETSGLQVRRDALGGTGEFRVYRASNPDAIRFTTASGKIYPIKWIPSIHMPRYASRILLEITDVRVERLKHIPRDGIIAEGYPAERATDGGEYDPFLWYRDLWESIYGAGSWQANPWIWVIEFKQIK
ncbi:hypothetical protein [Pectobacterium parvum]|uniref:Morphogenetic protein n=1 Tax=Pectobacterium parvum TaxID=2778550 RepID=A0AAP9LEL6_9GAMM|nr:hypothetical protein [Pectobacterium parvum]QHQ25889.1 hypothetical protein GMX10_19020 [Pectobacterium parvum]UVD99359.1 hypothetical protein NV347_10410 [Pectobacterium parvum]